MSACCEQRGEAIGDEVMRQGKTRKLKKYKLKRDIPFEGFRRVKMPRGSDLRDADLQSANLHSADLLEAKLQGAVLNRANLYWANLGGAKLQDAEFRDADLQSANLYRADIYGADFQGAVLKGATLSYILFWDEWREPEVTSFKGADLRGADFSWSFCHNWDFQDADLKGANFEGASLEGAKNLDKAKNLHLAKNLDKDKLPPGFVIPKKNPTKASKKKAAKKKVAKKKVTRAKCPPAATLVKKCRKLWESYCERPSKTRLKTVFEHLELMKQSKAKSCKEERARCLRAANKEAKRLGMK